MSTRLNQYINVFAEQDWESLEQIVEHITSSSPSIVERPSRGDSRNELLQLCVVRFIVRENHFSKKINDPYCSKIIEILDRANFLPLIKEHLNIKNLNILRMQLNIMEKNSFIAVHTDKESDPAYIATAILRTHSSFENGELVLYETNKKIIKQKNRSVFLIDSSIEHEVLPVTRGQRNSFVIVLGVNKV